MDVPGEDEDNNGGWLVMVIESSCLSQESE